MKKIGIDWLEVIVAPDSLRASMEPQILPTDTRGQTCYVVRIEDSWLVGRGEAVVFDSPPAARRFLDMVGIATRESDTVMVDPAASLGLNCRSTQTCFHLSSKGGLGTCPHKFGMVWRDATPSGVMSPADAMPEAA